MKFFGKAALSGSTSLNSLALAVALTVTVATPALAQDAPPQADAVEEETTAGNPIVVTGSRIQSPTITSVAPVQVVDDQAIDDSGVTNIQDLLLENPVFGVPALSRTNSAFLTSGTGVATVDLRDLGSDRTLVLINSRRVVAGLPGSAIVDLNVIPTQFIERIDILTGGASSLYGSDAVAGVVNFIYKSKFEGLEATGQYGLTERGDTREYQVNLTAGGNFADDRGNMMAHFGYTNQGGLGSRERKNTFFDDLDTFAALTGDPADFGTPLENRFSGLPPQGVFTSGGCQFTFNPATNALERGFSAAGGNISNAQAAACGVPQGTALPARGFNRQFFRTISVPVRRYLFAMRGDYDITDGINVFMEGTYARTSAAREIEPFGIQTSGSTGIFPADGLYPIQTRVPVAGAPGTFTIVNNPFVPAAIFNAATDQNGDGLRDVAFSRRLLEFGTRNSTTDRDFYRFVLGLQGELFDGKFNWDVAYNYGRTRESQEGNGQVNIQNFRDALAVINGPTGPICADPQARANGCVPVNVFGFGTISPQATAFIQANQTFQTRIQQQVLTGNLSGELFELPAGPLGVAVGVEYRRETSNENNDSLTNQGLNGGNALPDTSGKFNVKEAYGELNISILADTPFFHQLNLRAAGRISDYSTVGTVYTYSGGVEWAPIPDLRLSGTYARSVRAPNIGELFTGPSQTFPTGLNDPCIGITAASTGTLADTCRSFPGVNANIAANGAFTVTQSDRQSVSGFNLGNPNLSEEKSDSYTAAVVFTPRSIDALRNLTLRVDYYNIEIKDAIIGVGRQFILNKCFNEGDQDFCQFITRRAMATAVNSFGSLEFINQAQVNGGALKSEGIDLTVNYRWPLDGRMGLPGAINFRGTYTHLLDGFVRPVPGDPTKDPFDGEIGNSKDRFTANLGYQSERFDLSFTGTYIGKSYEDDQLLAAFDLGPKDISVDPEFYLDMQATFKPGDHYEFYVGVDNLLDNDPPNILSGTSFNVTGTDTAADVYDVFGRRYYAGVRLRF